MKKTAGMLIVGFIIGLVGQVGLAQGPLTPFLNALGRTSSGAVMVSMQGACGTPGPLTALANLAVRTSDGALEVCGVDGGAQSFATVTATTYVVNDGEASTDVNLVNSSGILYFDNGNGVFDSYQVGYGHIALSSAARGTGSQTGRRILISRNNSGNGAAGHLALITRDGNPYYLWVDTTGDLRISTAPPEEDDNPADTSGTVVGSQS